MILQLPPINSRDEPFQFAFPFYINRSSVVGPLRGEGDAKGRRPGSNQNQEKFMKKLNQCARRAVPIVLALIIMIAMSSLGSASTGNIVKSDLAGNWLIALHGTTGCGIADMEADVSINSSGAGTGTLISHGQCGDSTLTGQTFTINSVKANGSGTAGLSCGTGCGWNFNIQVSPDRSKFNLVDVATVNPGNFVEGLAVRKSSSGKLVVSDLTGSWQATLYGSTGCGVGTTVLSFTLNSSGVASNISETYHTVGCGDGSSNTNSFTILSLNSDGSGTANLTCGTGCGWNFDIQVSPDRSTFNLVDVYSLNVGNFQAGSAINNSTVPNIVKTNLAGKWQLVTYGQGGCGVASTLVTFTLNGSGVATDAAETSHTAGCGDGTSTGNTFTIQSLNANGSGTANLSCGPSCGFNYNIQVSPDRSTISVVDASSANPGNFQVGTSIHE
jgi:hypothetical protein